jgi:hypothetical protein
MSGLAVEVEKGLAHISWCSVSEKGYQEALALLLSSKGDVQGCLSQMKAAFERKALLAWFEHKDLSSMRVFAYAAAKAKWLIFRFDEAYPAFTPLWFLVSNHPKLIEKFVAFGPPAHLERRGISTTQIAYLGLTTALCVKGDWQRVIERCDHILTNPPRKAWLKYQIDYEIMRAIAKKDKAEIERTLSILVSPKMQRVRNYELPFGLTEHFIGTQAVTYAKMAWYHGLEVEVDTPSIPKEWLPMTPEDAYPDQHEYFARFDLFSA